MATVQMNLRMPPGLKKRIDAWARRERRTKTEFMIEAAEEKLARETRPRAHAGEVGSDAA